jgi:signal peptide peptidase SppA
MWFFNRGPVVPVLRFDGPIGLVTPLRPGLAISSCATAIERTFEMSKLPSVAVVINSPGGSAVQSSLIFRRIRQFADETRKTVHVFCEDVAASGGYYLAVAGDEIYADAASILGSIGVIYAGFGFVEAIEKLGITRRVYTAGEEKGSLDAFRPERTDDVERLKSLQRDVHDVFIGIVKERRAERLKGIDQELFSGAFWSATKALELGLIDGVGDVRTRMRELYGDKVRLKVVPHDRGGLLTRFRRAPSVFGYDDLTRGRLAFGEDLISAIEARALWSRYGL